MKEKSVLLKLANVLTGSDNSHRHEIGYLVRKWKDQRLPQANRREARNKIDQLEAELARRKEERRRVLESLKAKAAERIRQREELGMNNRTRPDGEDYLELTTDSTDLPEHVELSSTEPHPQEVMPNHWPYFEEVFMVSALDGDGISKLKVRMYLNVLGHCIMHVLIYLRWYFLLSLSRKVKVFLRKVFLRFISMGDLL